MPKITKTETVETVICDFCGKTTVNGMGVITLYFKSTEKLFLLEKDSMRKYETFNITDKKEMVFCDRACGHKFLSTQVMMFLSLQ